MDMDVVVYSLASESEQKLLIGAVQEDGSIHPLTAWTDEPVFGNSMEFLVDESDDSPGLQEKDVVVHVLVDSSNVSYGSRQVLENNPHGEHAEITYYVEKDVVKDIDFPIKPELEMLY